MTSLKSLVGRLLIAIPFPLVAACSGSGNESSSRGDEGTGGQGSSDGGTTGTGGDLVGGDGDGDDTGGGDGDGAGGGDGDGAGGGEADGAGGAGMLGDSDDTVGCAIADEARLFPYVGPFLFGPNPGPCTSSDDSVFVYEDGLVSGDETYAEIYERDETGRMVRIVEDFATMEYSYSEGEISWINPSDMILYTIILDERGYPQILQVGDTGAIYGVLEYVYESCRLVERHVLATGRDHQPSVYTYDESGNMISISYGDQLTTFDYSCW